MLGKVYKIINSSDTIIDIGSTKEKLCKRLAHVKKKYDKNIKIVLIEEYEIDNNEQLKKYEQYYNQLLIPKTILIKRR